MLDMYEFLENIVSSYVAFLIVFSCAFVVGLWTGKWKKFYFARKE